MGKIAKLFVFVGLLSIASFSAKAAGLAEQVAAAIAKGDYKTVRTLVNDNPGSTGQAQNALLDAALGKLVSQPQEAAQIMTVASSLSKGIEPKDAGSIAEKLRKIVKTIADKSLLVCNPEAADDASRIQAPLDPKKTADAQAISSVMEAAGALAQAPAIVAIDPELFAQIQEKSGQCQTGDEEALLAQRPLARPGTIMPHLQRPGFPPPPQRQGSPD